MWMGPNVSPRKKGVSSSAPPNTARVYASKYQCVKKIPARKFGPSGLKYGKTLKSLGIGWGEVTNDWWCSTDT